MALVFPANRMPIVLWVALCSSFALLVLEMAQAQSSPALPADPFNLIKALSVSGDVESDENVARSVREALESALLLTEKAPTVVRDNWVFDDEKVKALLVSLTEAQPSVSRLIAELYSFRLRETFAEGKLPDAEKAYQQVLKFRKDPSPENDTLRLWIAFHARSDADWYFAKGRVSELDTKHVSLLSRIRLAHHGYYGSFYPRIFYTGLGVLALLYAISHFNVRLRIPVVNVSEIRLPTREKKVKGYERIPSSPDEYSQLLGVFGLDENASDAAIKKAYRRMVKDCHPDKLGTDPDPDLVEKFQTLTEMHNRILQIRGSFFGR